MTPVPAPVTPVKANDAGPPPSTLTRRQRNVNQHRAMDMEFATEIGQNLLHEVRRLQALVNERDRTISESNDAWDAERDTLVTAVRTAEANAGVSHVAAAGRDTDKQNNSRTSTGASRSTFKSSAASTPMPLAA